MNILEHLTQRHPELFFWIEQQFVDDELPPEPSPAELAAMDADAESLLESLKEDEDDKNPYGNL